MRQSYPSRLSIVFSLSLVLGCAAALLAQDQANEIVCTSTTGCTTGFIPIFSTSGGSANVGNSLFSQSGTLVTLNANETIKGNLAATGSVSGASASFTGSLGFNGNLNMANSTATTGNLLKGGALFLHNFGAGSNAFLGLNAGNLTMTGNNNTGIGSYALHAVTVGCCNTATGNNALLQNTTGGGNTASGDGALYSNTTGSGNTATGRWALISNNTGINNTATGTTALQDNCSSPCQPVTGLQLGSYNTATGVGALYSNKDGSDNTATGVNALHNNCASPCYYGEGIGGGYNTATGTNALYNNTTGLDNTASGTYALYGNTTGAENSAAGYGALYSNTTGNYNTAEGLYAMYSNTTGAANTAIGFEANVGQSNLFNATAIGYGAIVNASNKIRLGNSSVTVVEGPPYSVVSDKNKKENFRSIDAEEVLRKVRDLNVMTWNYIGHDSQVRHYGPVAQDFFAAFGHDGLGIIGSPTTISSTDLDGILLLAVQALEKRVVELGTVKAENADLRARLEKLEARARGKGTDSDASVELTAIRGINNR
jgi:trimeric autotransporter adhesin